MRRFEISAAPAGAMIELAVKIVGNDGSIVGARIFRAEAPVAVLDAPSSAAALNEAFEQVAAEIVQWTCATI
jgi:phospholipid/cholesterol/gamma-HCH transport system substrate-binding protein